MKPMPMCMNPLVIRVFATAMMITVGCVPSLEAQMETSQGIVYRTQVTACMDACSQYFLQGDPGFQSTYLKGNVVALYVGSHVRVVGVRVMCVECSAIEVSQVSMLPVTAVPSINAEAPTSTSTARVYPNPFNPTTTVEFSLLKGSHVTVIVHDLLGREVAKLLDEDRPAGVVAARWNGKTSAGFRANSGVYVCKLVAVPSDGGKVITYAKKMILAR